MRPAHSILAVLAVLIFGLSFAVPANDLPETAYDESETPVCESTPLFCLTQPESCLTPSLELPFQIRAAGGEMLPERLETESYSLHRSLTIRDHSLRC